MRERWFLDSESPKRALFRAVGLGPFCGLPTRRLANPSGQKLDLPFSNILLSGNRSVSSYAGLKHNPHNFTRLGPNVSWQTLHILSQVRVTSPQHNRL
jgi:hypothetical protein